MAILAPTDFIIFRRPIAFFALILLSSVTAHSRLRLRNGFRASGFGPQEKASETAAEMTKQSDLYRENAENCMQMAEAAPDEPAYNRYKRMEAAWLALAEEQDWLDGERPPVDPGPAERKVRRKRRPSSASKLSKINLRRQIVELGLKAKGN